MHPDPSSATDLLVGVSFHRERKEGQRSWIPLSDGAKMITWVPQVITLTPLFIIAESFHSAFFYRWWPKMPTEESSTSSKICFSPSRWEMGHEVLGQRTE